MVITINRKQDPYGAVVKAELLDHLGNEVAGVLLPLPNMTPEEERDAIFAKLVESYKDRKQAEAERMKLVRKIRKNRSKMQRTQGVSNGVKYAEATIELDGQTYGHCVYYHDDYESAMQEAELTLLQLN